jgi:hypothetical protein
LKRFSSTFDDPFSDVVSAFDQPIHGGDQDPETPSIERDNKLLSFSLPSFDYNLLDFNFRQTTISLGAQLHGMFFLAESPWASATDALPPPSELTCYRRNLFQITGEITLPRMLRYLMTESGEQIMIMGHELVVSATESTEGNAVKIISVPWKTPANPGAPAVEDKTEREPHSIPLDLMSMPDMNTDYATFPFSWKRLQFRIATANNGRRKELQQHFVVRIKVLATLSTGGKIPICEVRSGAIIVRGRSPRNFQARKDLPLNASGHARKAGGSQRPGSGDSTKVRLDGPTSAPIKVEAAPAESVASLFDPNDAQRPVAGNYDWTLLTTSAHKGAMTAIPHNLPSPLEPMNLYAISSPDLSRNKARALPTPPAAPINLSLVEDESPRVRNSATPDGRAPKKLQIPPRPPSFSINTINSPDESADLLYEYFPLGLDDWMPPVDAVYRPHVVHHTKLPTDPRDPKIGSKGSRSKRYFTEDVS